MKPGSCGSLYDKAAFSRCLLDTMTEKTEISMSALEAPYSVDDIEARVLAAIRVAGFDPDRCLAPVELAALGHFRPGGLRASRVPRDLANIRAEDRILAIGAGLADPARMLAPFPGCQVACIDLSSDYGVSALLLKRVTGLEERIEVRVSSALDTPFAGKSFDVVWMQNAARTSGTRGSSMRKSTASSSRGGRFAFQETVASETAATCFPLPWATGPAGNSLVCAGEMRTVLAQSGFPAVCFADLGEKLLPPANKWNSGRCRAGASESVGVFVDNLARKAASAKRRLREGEIRLVFRAVFSVK